MRTRDRKDHTNTLQVRLAWIAPPRWTLMRLHPPTPYASALQSIELWAIHSQRHGRMMAHIGHTDAQLTVRIPQLSQPILQRVTRKVAGSSSSTNTYLYKQVPRTPLQRSFLKYTITKTTPHRHSITRCTFYLLFAQPTRKYKTWCK